MTSEVLGNISQLNNSNQEIKSVVDHHSAQVLDSTHHLNHKLDKFDAEHKDSLRAVTHKLSEVDDKVTDLAKASSDNILALTTVGHMNAMGTLLIVYLQVIKNENEQLSIKYSDVASSGNDSVALIRELGTNVRVVFLEPSDVAYLYDRLSISNKRW